MCASPVFFSRGEMPTLRFLMAAREDQRHAAAALAILLCAACATPEGLRAGASEADVRSRFGRPDAEYALPDTGGKRLEYVFGPYAQRDWMIDLDRNGRVVASDQVRTMEHFFALRTGQDDQAQVRRTVGTPFQIERYTLSGLTAFLYPYRESGAWDSMMAVYFDASGHVVRVENGPDPRFLGPGRVGGDK